jgi:hypothetical protein
VQEASLVRRLRTRHVLWLHGWFMGLLTLAAMLLTTAALRHAGVETLALRYAVALGVGYAVYLLLVRLWAGVVARDEDPSLGDIDFDSGQCRLQGHHHHDGGGLHSGGGGDFGGGGASGHWDGALDGAGDAAGSALGDVASGALDAVGAADEGAIVIIPVLAVFAAAVAVLLGAGGLLLAWFGTEVLLTVAVELAFAWTAASTVLRVEREGWLLAAVRLTWKPMLGALVCAVALGALVDHFVPQADSLPQALRLWRGR